MWFIGGGSHNSVAIEMKDHLILVEAPLNDGRTGPVIDQVQQARAEQADPLRDQLAPAFRPFGRAAHGGRRRRDDRDAGAEQGVLRAGVRRAEHDQPRTASRSRARRRSSAATTSASRCRDGTRRVELYHIVDSHHTDSFTMVYLPKEKLLIEADAFTPGAPNTPPPEQPNPNHTNLIDNLQRLNLAVDRIVPLHGRVVPVGELYTAAGARLARGVTAR